MTNDKRTALLRLRAIRFQSANDARIEVVTAVASHFHDAWREDRWNEVEQRYTPRFKKLDRSADQVWVENELPTLRRELPECFRGEGEFVEIDIANLAYALLSPSWQRENRAQAEGIVNECVRHLAVGGSVRDEAFRHTAAINAHERWIRRNESWLYEGVISPNPEEREYCTMLLRHFDRLLRHEQIKDETSVDAGIVAIETYLMQMESLGDVLPESSHMNFHTQPDGSNLAHPVSETVLAI